MKQLHNHGCINEIAFHCWVINLHYIHVGCQPKVYLSNLG